MKVGGAKPARAGRPRPALQREVSPLVAGIVILIVVLIIVAIVFKPWRALTRPTMSERQKEMVAELTGRGWTIGQPIPEDIKQKYPAESSQMPTSPGGAGAPRVPPPPAAPGPGR
jgi:hypothetical protein